MKVTVNSVATIKTTKPLTPLLIAKSAQPIVGKSIDITIDSSKTVADLCNMASAAFNFPGVKIVKVVCEKEAPLDNGLALISAGIRDGDNVKCRFTVDID